MTLPKLCVIFNPAAARGRARRRLKPWRRWLGARADFLASTGPGHAEVLALEAAARGYATVVAAGGDGTVHEVANGLLRAARNDVAFGVLPLGSGNDYAHSLGGPADARRRCQQLTAASTWCVDVGRVRDDCGRERFFVNTLGLGFSGAVAVESRRIRGLRGLALYGLATLRALCWHFHCPDTRLTLDDQPADLPTLSLTVALGSREGGGFVVAPAARLDDGWFDFLHAGKLTRWQALGWLPLLALGRVPQDHPSIRMGHCRKVHLESAASLLIHLDGELFAQPGDHVRSLDIELLPAALRVRGSRPTDGHTHRGES